MEAINYHLMNWKNNNNHEFVKLGLLVYIEYVYVINYLNIIQNNCILIFSLI
jgi:hypothetical protein